MPYFLLQYKIIEGFRQKRAPFRSTHLELVHDAHARGGLLLAGAFDPPDGAALLFESEDDSPARSFAASDPYIHEGLVKEWRIRRWDVVIGHG